MSNLNETEEIVKRLIAYPKILNKIKEMLDLIEKNQIETADDFEEALIPEVRGFGKEILQTWVANEEGIIRKNLENKESVHHSKKLHWNTTFGEIEIVEQIFLLNSRIYRPIVQKLKVYCRSYSRPLQRRITDFGADESFGQAVEKMKEHYGIEVPICAIQKITEKHGKEIAKWKPKQKPAISKLLITEMDGSMVPIVEIEEKTKGVDLRKTRKVCWKEAKLCFAREHGKVSRIYAAIIGSPKEAGTKLYECAKDAGLATTTYVHALGDGAQWIVDQVEEQFGSQAHFLIDFFHMCEYLAEAATWCNPLAPHEWLEEKRK